MVYISQQLAPDATFVQGDASRVIATGSIPYPIHENFFVYCFNQGSLSLDVAICIFPFYHTNVKYIICKPIKFDILNFQHVEKYFNVVGKCILNFCGKSVFYIYSVDTSSLNNFFQVTVECRHFLLKKGIYYNIEYKV